MTTYSSRSISGCKSFGKCKMQLKCELIQWNPCFTVLGALGRNAENNEKSLTREDLINYFVKLLSYFNSNNDNDKESWQHTEYPSGILGACSVTLLMCRFQSFSTPKCKGHLALITHQCYAILHNFVFWSSSFKWLLHSPLKENTYLFPLLTLYHPLQVCFPIPSVSFLNLICSSFCSGFFSLSDMPFHVMLAINN